MVSCCLFFSKQRTAYELRISDWSPEVCSSDLRGGGQQSGDLGRRRRGLVRPAGALADVHELQRRRRVVLSRDLLEQRRLLGAGDDDRLLAEDGALEVAELRPAELGVQLGLALGAEGLAGRSEEPTSELQSLM